MPAFAISLLVIRSPDIEESRRFYSVLGLRFFKEAHGTGPEHYTAEVEGAVFEIYPVLGVNYDPRAYRFGFHVHSLEIVVAKLKTIGAKVLVEPRESEWGRIAVVEDPHGHKVELCEFPEEGDAEAEELLRKEQKAK